MYAKPLVQCSQGYGYVCLVIYQLWKDNHLSPGNLMKLPSSPTSNASQMQTRQAPSFSACDYFYFPYTIPNEDSGDAKDVDE